MAISQLYKIFSHWANQTVWLYSDPHFGDAELDAIVPNRPSAEKQVKMINAKVGKKDTLIILGDIGDSEYVKQLRGYKVLICGNHDAGVSNYAEIFDEVYTGPVFIGEKLLLSHEPLDFPGALNIHGHVHNPKVKGDSNHLNVCSDVINYTPVNMNQLMKSGILGKITTVHRTTIDKATKRSKRRKKNG